VGTARRVVILIAIAVSLAVAANALSPRGLSWKEPLGHGLRAEVVAAGLTPVDVKDIRALLADRSILFLDVRPAEEFDTGHLPGAKNIPWNRIIGDAGDASAELRNPIDRPIIVYCSNEFCVFSLQVGAQLKRNGHRNVAVFVDGYEAWWNTGGADASK
jgi:rhodanese-related sulfurtransferase